MNYTLEGLDANEAVMLMRALEQLPLGQSRNLYDKIVMQFRVQDMKAQQPPADLPADTGAQS